MRIEKATTVDAYKYKSSIGYLTRNFNPKQANKPITTPANRDESVSKLFSLSATTGILGPIK